MGSMRQWVVLSATALLAGGCQILSYGWTCPAAVPAGRLFTMEVTGQSNNAQGTVGVVLQVPNGFTVAGASGLGFGYPLATPLQRDEPALLALYTPDPGHYLASFSGSAPVFHTSVITGLMKVYLQAPAAAGTYQLEMALACGASGGGGWVSQLGLTSFQVAGASAVRTLQVNAVPAPPPFALSAGVFDVEGPDVRDVDAADIDRDGRADLVVTTATAFHVRRSVPGGFAPLGPPVTVAGVVYGMLGCAVADFDGDGFADVGVPTGTVYFGDGGATWTPVVAAVPNLQDPSVAAGDVDGDGLADLVIADQGTVLVVRGQANRTFLPWSSGLPSTTALSSWANVEVVDLDADGRGEIVLCGSSGPTAPAVHRSTPAGAWSLVGTLPGFWRVLAIDVDGNGTRELLPHNTGQLFTYTPQGLVPGSFVPLTTFRHAVAIDFDRDGRDDIANCPLTTGDIQLWRNNGGSFQPVALPAANGFGFPANFRGIVAADFDDDTFPDLGAALDRVLAWHNTAQGTAPFGEPCGPPAALAPALSVQGSVAPGQTGVVQLANAIPQVFTLMWLGHSRTWWNGQPVLPLDLGVVGAPGCTLVAEPLAVFGVVADGAGVASLPFAVPLFPPNAEATVFVQGAVPAPGANALGIVFSRGLALKMQ